MFFSLVDFNRSLGGLIIPVAMTIAGIYIKERAENKKWAYWLPLYPYLFGLTVSIFLNYPGFLRKSYYGIQDFEEPYLFSKEVSLVLLVLNYSLLIGGYLFIKKKSAIPKKVKGEKKAESRFSAKKLGYLLYLILVLHLIAFVIMHTVYWSARFFQVQKIKNEFIEQTKLNYIDSEEIKLRDINIDVISYDNPIMFKKVFDLVVLDPNNVPGYLEYLTSRLCTQVESSSYDPHIDVYRYTSKSNELIGFFSDDECPKYLKELIPKYKTVLGANYLFYDEFMRLQIGYDVESRIDDIKEENRIYIENIIINLAKEFRDDSCTEKEPFKYGIFAVSSDKIVITGIEIDHSNCNDSVVRNIFSNYKFSKKELEFLEMGSPIWFSSTLNTIEEKLIPLQE